MKIPLASSGLRQGDIDIAVSVLNSGQLTMGAQVKKFELAMADYLKVKHFIMVNSGSSANLAMIEALVRPTNGKPKLKAGDCVLVPAIAWPTTIWPIIQLGLHPIFVDIDLDTLGIDLEKAQIKIDSGRKNIKAIFPIHILGRSLELKKLDEFTKKNNLILINDVCEALGSWDEGVHAGTTGLAGSYSFYFSHHITTMEGGGIATNDDEYADDIRSIRSHGWSRDRLDVKKWTSDVSANDAKFLFVSTGYNIRPMEIQAAIGCAQIADVEGFIKKRRLIATKVAKSLVGTRARVIGADTLHNEQMGLNHSWMLIPIMCDDIETKRRLIESLSSSDIETRPVLTGNFLSQPAIERIDEYHEDPKNFPNANEITANCFLVSAHHDLDENQIEYLCQKLLEFAPKIG
jgi:CDP-4-dehydro-6-deoxyglucose reductase, E1